MRKTILKFLVVALVLVILPAGAFASVWNADDISLRADHGTEPAGPYDENYDPEAYWDYFLKNLLETLNANNNEDVGFSLEYLDCSEIIALLTDVDGETAALLCSDDPDERKQGMLNYWAMSGLGGNFFGFSAALADVDTSRAASDATVTFQTAPFITDDVDGYAPSQLALYKLFNEGGTLPFVGYASSPSANTDGYWCLLTYQGAYVGTNEILNKDGAYTIRYWIKNNGSYDQDPSDGIVLDPVTLAYKAAGDDDGDGDGGCVLNAAAGLSLEWLLLLLAPALLIFRRRK